jgi:hypothetical protein
VNDGALRRRAASGESLHGVVDRLMRRGPERAVRIVKTPTEAGFSPTSFLRRGEHVLRGRCGMDGRTMAKAEEVAMRQAIHGTNLTVFILFFGLAMLDAFSKRNWVLVALWLVFGLVFLRADLPRRGLRRPPRG